ncbi:MAG: hypothetical protein V1495_07720 [Pseudomonadota bacterium]
MAPALLILATFVAAAAPTPEELSQKLSAAFQAGAGVKAAKSSVTEKNIAGFRLRTVGFEIGNRVYRVVFSSDGSLTVSVLAEGEIAATKIWEGRTDRISVEEIVNLIYVRERGRKFDAGEPRREKDPTADLEKRAVRREVSPFGSGEELRWSQMIDQMAKGGASPISTKSGGGTGDFDRARSMGRAMDPCGEGSGGMSPQRAAISDIATAMAAAMAAQMMVRGARKGPARAEAGFSDRSREFEKKGSSSVLEDLEKSRGANSPAEMIRLIQDTGSNTTELFKRALAESDQNSRDPYSLAASRNFRRVIASLGEKRASALVAEVLKAIAVDVTAFTDRRVLTPDAAVIFDRRSGHYFIDPTLNSPSEARFLLSLATWYASEMERFGLIEAVEQYKEALKKISELERVMISESDERALQKERAATASAARKLGEFAERLRKDAARP